MGEVYAQMLDNSYFISFYYFSLVKCEAHTNLLKVYTYLVTSQDGLNFIHFIVKSRWHFKDIKWIGRDVQK